MDGDRTTDLFGQDDPRARRVPDGRAARFLRLGGMTAGIVGGMVATGLRQAARGERPRLATMALTPATAARLARDLGRMRGAAMKLGQLMSMDTGSLLPPEMTAILSSLRADAPPMPPAQLRDMLDAEWGPGWYGRLARFDVRPFAAASIGQVHRARSRDGRDLAIKVQYPGVRASIDGDIANLGALLRLPGLVPRGADLAPLLAEARRQLHAEADYAAEAANLASFAQRLAGDPRFLLPALVPELSTPRVLAMTYVDSQPIEALEDAPQALRDRVAGDLVALCLAELFDWGRMQTDPNLANYRWDPVSERVVLLDFGAVLAIEAGLAARFRRLLAAALAQDAAAVRAAMVEVGYLAPGMPAAQQDLIQAMFDRAMDPLRQPAPFDFGATRLVEALRDMGLELGTGRDLTHVPPPATLFLHRKIGGIFLLAQRLRARVALRPLVERYG